MMGRFCRYVDKVFHFGQQLQTLSDTRLRPQIPAAAVFASAWGLFATGRGSLNRFDKEARLPSRLRAIVGPRIPSGDTIGRVFTQLDSGPVRRMLSSINRQVRRNKALGPSGTLMVAAVDGHEFFSSRKRCCPDCQTRTIEVNGQAVTEYYHRGVICHLTGHPLALPLDLELQRPGEGEETAAKRLLERVFVEYSRFFDVITGDALYLDAPFINFCVDHHKDVIVVVKGDRRLLFQDAEQLFSQRVPSEWSEGRRTVRYWDNEGFTSCDGVKAPLRVLHTEETVRRHATNRWAGEDPDVELVLGHHALQESILDAGFMAGRTRSLGHRERLLQHALDLLGVGPLLPTSGQRDGELHSRLLHRLRVTAMLLARQSQTLLPENDWQLDWPLRRTLSGPGIALPRAVGRSAALKKTAPRSIEASRRGWRVPGPRTPSPYGEESPLPAP